MIRVYGDDAGSGYGYYGAQIEVGSVTARPGGSVYLELSGFMPGEPIEIGVRSEYTKLAEWAADPAGGASGTVTLPSDLEPGQHTIVAIGLSSGRWVEAILNVVAEDVSDPDDDPDDADDSGDGGKKSGRLPGAANDAVSA
jgi:hypothetical protein